MSLIIICNSTLFSFIIQQVLLLFVIIVWKGKKLPNTVPQILHIFNYCVTCPTTTNLNLIEIHGIYRPILVIAAGSEMIKQMQFPIVWTPQCKRNLIFRKICIPPAKTFQSFVACCCWKQCKSLLQRETEKSDDLSAASGAVLLHWQII